jgi:hypothetical protein
MLHEKYKLLEIFPKYGDQATAVTDQGSKGAENNDEIKRYTRIFLRETPILSMARSGHFGNQATRLVISIPPQKSSRKIPIRSIPTPNLRNSRSSALLSGGAASHLVISGSQA